MRRRFVLVSLATFSVLLLSFFPTSSKVLALPSKNQATTTTTIAIPATQAWTDTGMDISKGASISIIATGTIFIAGSDPGKSPDGDPTCTADSSYTAPGLACWALIGTIANGTPFLVGSTKGLVAHVSGRLFLGVNDNVFGDNDGEWSVTLQVTTHPHRKLIVFLQGINTSLNMMQANNGQIVGMHKIPQAVRDAFPEASANPNDSSRLLEFSYFGSRTDNGLPGAYNCQDTFTNSLLTDILNLDQQIKNAFKVEPAGADVDIYLIGHSLGGAIALGYLDFLEQQRGVSLPTGGHLKAVITLDSPLGGASGWLANSFVVNQVFGSQCNLTDVPLNSVRDMATVFDSPAQTTPPDDNGPDPLGASASFLTLFGGALPTPIPSNEDLVENAQSDMGTSFLSIGNLNDFLYNPQACLSTLPTFLDSQFIEDNGEGNGIYGRDFVSGSGDCPGLLTARARKQTTRIALSNHFAALTDENVEFGMVSFLFPLESETVGGTPGVLQRNPFQPGES